MLLSECLISIYLVVDEIFCKQLIVWMLWSVHTIEMIRFFLLCTCFWYVPPSAIVFSYFNNFYIKTFSSFRTFGGVTCGILAIYTVCYIFSLSWSFSFLLKMIGAVYTIVTILQFYVLWSFKFLSDSVLLLCWVVLLILAIFLAAFSNFSYFSAFSQLDSPFSANFSYFFQFSNSASMCSFCFLVLN